MGTVVTIFISIMIGATCGVMLMAIVVNGGATVRKSANAVIDYCDGRECCECKFHSNEAPYCELGYPFSWKLVKEEDKEANECCGTCEHHSPDGTCQMGCPAGWTLGKKE